MLRQVGLLYSLNLGAQSPSLARPPSAGELTPGRGKHIAHLGLRARYPPEEQKPSRTIAAAYNNRGCGTV